MFGQHHSDVEPNDPEDGRAGHSAFRRRASGGHINDDGVAARHHPFADGCLNLRARLLFGSACSTPIEWEYRPSEIAEPRCPNSTASAETRQSPRATTAAASAEASVIAVAMITVTKGLALNSTFT
jgi:hypothetical protein